MKRVAFPFLTLSEFAVTASTWWFSLNNSEWSPLGEYLEDWDPGSVVRLRREIRIDPAIASDDLSLNILDSELLVLVALGTGQGRLPRFIIEQHSKLMCKQSWIVGFEFEVLGDLLSSVIDVSTRVVLATKVKGGSVLSPSRLGDLLWSDRARSRLEGEEPRFPIEIADIGSLAGEAISSFAPWYLHWSPREWSRDFHGALRLYLSHEHGDLIDRVESEDPMTLRMLLADIMGQVCERFITDPEVADLFNSPEPGSLASQAASWLKKAWPGKDHDFIKSVFDNRPGVFRASLVALADLGEGE
ncbi:hypothetical protein [Pseudomonas sp. CC120222-01a]|uniref:hypothetical protein n=1 Tax=Pseudomonas sp. CC120222-01a TaxID=1378075 RepID=UPI000D820519|nr:hypothetical protein [Pseudomonas sp. CC120222-01a]PVZ41313.1 hypothetical protein N430_02376 [Pseudomonas sp. CC120222-01a]